MRRYATAAGRTEPPRRSCRLLSIGTVLAAMVATLTASAAAANADVLSGPYALRGTGGLSQVTAEPVDAVAGAVTSFEISFTTAGSLGAGAQIVLSDPITSNTVTRSVTRVQIYDSDGACLVGEPGYSVGPTGLVVDPGASCALPAGDRVHLDVLAPAPPASFAFTVSLLGSPVAVASNVVTVTTASPSASAGSVVPGQITSYDIGPVPIVALSGDGSSVTVQAQALDGYGAVAWAPGAGAYQVTYTPPGSTAGQVDGVTGAVLSSAVRPDDTVTLSLSSPVGAGGTVTIRAEGTNPASGGTDQFLVLAGPGNPERTNPVVYGTSVTGVTVTAAPLVAAEPAAYVVRFTATSGIPAGGSVVVSQSGTDFSHIPAANVDDVTAGWSGDTDPSAGVGVATVPVERAVAPGDTVTVSLYNVPNPPPGTVENLDVSTSTDSLPVAAPPLHMSATAATGGARVSVSPAVAGMQADYTITNLTAGRSASAGALLTLGAVPGTVLPSDPAAYTVEDSTSPAGSGHPTQLLVGPEDASATLRLPGDVANGDQLSLVVAGVTNPAVPGQYVMTVGGVATGQASTSTPVFPQAGASLPNGAIISFGGTVYVMAGGHAFGAATAEQAIAVEAVDHATVVVAAPQAPAPSAPPRAGTLVAAAGSGTIYVCGTDAKLHGFASPGQFMAEGYDPAQVATVPSLGAEPVGAPVGQLGPAGNALSTRADGAIVVSSGAYYVLAGGRAFAVPSPSALAALRSSDRAWPLSGAVPDDLVAAPTANGVLVATGGGVYVSYAGALYLFKSMSQLRSDGYGGTPVVALPGTGTAALVTRYTGP